MSSPRKPRTSARVRDLARLDPHAFRVSMLEQILTDLETARKKGSMSAVMTLTAQAMRLRSEIAAAEEQERTALLATLTTEQLVAELLDLVRKLPDGVVEQLGAAIEQRRTGKPRMRIV